MSIGTFFSAKFCRARAIESIRETALVAGKTTGWQNVGAIYFSNKIVLDGLFNAAKPIRNLTTNALSDGTFKLFRNSKVKGEVWDVVEDNWKQSLKEFKDPKKFAAVGLNYFAANIAEGLQESAQESISGAAMDFYKEEWRGNVVKGGYFASITDNLHKQVSPEGLEVFMSGFLMGGMIAPMASTLGSFVPGSQQQSYLKSKWDQFRDPVNYKNMRDGKEAEMRTKAEMLNDLWNQVGKRLAPELDNLVAQNKYADGMAEANQENDPKAFYDLKDSSQYKHISTAIRTGKFDTYIDRLAELKNLSAEDIAKAYPGLSKEDHDNTIDQAVARAKKIEARYDMAQTEFKNPFNKSRFIGDQEAYEAEERNQQGWEDAQEKFVFLQYSFDRSLERFNSIMGEAQTDAQLSKVPTTDFTTMFHIETMVDEITRLNTEISALGDVTTKEGNALYKQKLRKRDLLADFAEKMEEAIVQPTVKGDITKLNKKNKKTKAALNKARTSYRRYLTFLADANKDHAFNNAIDNAFDKMTDAYMLNDESGKLNTAINKMLDPGTFTRQAAQDSEIRRLRKDQQQKELKDSLDAYVKAYEGNLLLEGLYELGIFFDHVQFEELIKNNVWPDKLKFYYLEDKNGVINDVIENSEDYDAAKKVVLDFVPGIMGIPISKAESDRASDTYNNETREKLEEDKRTYQDLGAQFGFDALAKETRVPLKQVLNAVINSSYATEGEILLAKQLIKRATESEVVTFSSQADNPGSYSTTSQTIINPQYSASNFEGADLPIEFVILHEEIHRRTAEQLKEDPQFADDINNLHAAVVAYLKENTPDETLPYGVKDTAEFIAEAMSNPKFQETLASIPYETTGKSAWAKFVDSVLNTLKKAFGGKKVKAGTALNEALHIITAKIDEAYPIKDGKVVKTKPGKTKSTVARTPGNTKLTNAIDMPTLRKDHPELAAEILALYQSKQGDPEFAFRDPDYATKKGDNAYKSIQFINYYESPSTAVDKLFAAYNLKNKRTLDPILKARTRTDVGEAIRARLKDKGYSKEERAELAKNVSLAVEIANRPGNKAQHESEDAAAVAAAEREDTLRANELMIVVSNFIDDASTYDELKKAKREIFNTLDAPAYSHPDSPDGWTVLLAKAEEAGVTSIGSVIENLVAAREDQLAFKANIEDIVPGSSIILKSGAEMIVDEVGKNKKILAHAATSPEKIIEFDITKVKFTSAGAITDDTADTITVDDNAKQATNDKNADDTDDASDDDINSTEDDAPVPIDC